VMKYIY